MCVVVLFSTKLKENHKKIKIIPVRKNKFPNWTLSEKEYLELLRLLSNICQDTTVYIEYVAIYCIGSM